MYMASPDEHAKKRCFTARDRSSQTPKSVASSSDDLYSGLMSKGLSHKASLGALTVGALGVVFGDIGTSPLYTLKECLHRTGGNRPTEADLYGVLSLIFWALMMVVSVKYLTFIMKADNRGEGGIFALLALVPEELRTAKPGRLSLVALLAALGAALLYGDGVITPAISVLSALEGLAVADPGWAGSAVPLSCVVLVVLFALQSRGTGTVGNLFGPIMVVWFVTLGALGLYHITYNPEILLAVSPHHAWEYFARHGWAGLHILASVVLAVTGGEALYADMGHFGVRPIRWAWLGLVFPSLILGYFGQGAHALRVPSSMVNPFFSLVPAGGATIALVILSSVAAVIASQALISGAFSLTRQAMQLGFFPRVRVLHTAHQMEGQIYVPEINLFTGLGSIVLVLMFRESSRLAAAFGIAVAGTMSITSIMYFLVLRKTWTWPLRKAMALLLLFLAFDIPFLVANLGKFADGGYVPIFLGAAVLFVMAVWNRGRTLLEYHSRVRFPSWEAALARVQAKLAARVPGTAVFLSSNAETLPNPLVRHVERSRSLHETVLLLTIRTLGRPTVPDEERYRAERLENGFWRVIVQFGFMEEPTVIPLLENIAQEAHIPFPADEVTYYLGRENFLASAKGQMGVVTESVFSFLQKNSVAADRFFGLPPRQVVELGTQLDL
jgi:KUP system potassium uptake protein